MKIESKIGKKGGLTSLQFLKVDLKFAKKDELTPLHFLKIVSKIGKGWTNLFTIYEIRVKIGKKVGLPFIKFEI